MSECPHQKGWFNHHEETDGWKVTSRSLRIFEGEDAPITGPTDFDDLKRMDTVWLTMIQDDLMSAFRAVQDELIRRAHIAYDNDLVVEEEEVEE